MKPTYEELEQQVLELSVQLANAESKCRELAAVVAENAALKNPDNWLSQSDYGYEASEVATQNGATKDKALRAGMLAIINRIKTPATDAFLAEVRAQGVEMFALQQSQIAAEQEQAGDYEFSRHCSISATEACEFAEELREGKCCEVQS